MAEVVLDLMVMVVMVVLVVVEVYVASLDLQVELTLVIKAMVIHLPLVPLKEIMVETQVLEEALPIL